MRIKECNIEEIMLEEYRDFSEKGRMDFMKNRNKWMIGGMLLAALGIGSFFT